MYENYPNQYPYINPYSGMARQPQQVMPQPQPQSITQIIIIIVISFFIMYHLPFL